nr:hydrolase [Propionibacterium sp.]
MASDRDPFDDTDRPGEEPNPLAEFMAQFGIRPGADGSVDLNELMGKLQQVMGQLSSQLGGFGGEGLNWAFVKDVARKVTAAQGADPSPTAADQRAIRDAVGLADLWLDQQISFGRLATTPAAWSRAEWVENTFDVWRTLVSPVATSLGAAITGLLGKQSAELGGLQPMMEPMMRAASSGMLSAQVGQALGLLSTDVLSACDMALPMTAKPVVALLPGNVARFGEGLEQPDADVRLYLALRETARQRLFAHVAWLGPQLLALVEHYARGITIDATAIEEAMESQLSGQVSPADLERLGETLSGTLFEPVQTPEQAEIMARLETLVALVEGWVDDVVGVTTASLMPGAPALLESVRRRRAVGGPTETALKQLLNLELRPRRVRDAANLWAALRTARGAEARDAAWAHPDLVPAVADLDDPLGYVERGRPAASPASPELGDLDADLARLLEEERGSGD